MLGLPVERLRGAARGATLGPSLIIIGTIFANLYWFAVDFGADAMAGHSADWLPTTHDLSQLGHLPLDAALDKYLYINPLNIPVQYWVLAAIGGAAVGGGIAGKKKG